MYRSDNCLSAIAGGQGNHSGGYRIHHRRDLLGRCCRHVLQHCLEHPATAPFKKEPPSITPRLIEQLCPREGRCNSFLSLEVNAKLPFHPSPIHPSSSTLIYRRSRPYLTLGLHSHPSHRTTFTLSASRPNSVNHSGNHFAWTLQIFGSIFHSALISYTCTYWLLTGRYYVVVFFTILHHSHTPSVLRFIWTDRWV